jgi:DNA-binding FrmR family transcriptional regulator
MNAKRKATVSHIRRIQGQINTLVKYFEEEKECLEIVMLMTSIAKSFDTLRFRTLEGFITSDLLTDRQCSGKQYKNLSKVLSLYKK